MSSVVGAMAMAIGAALTPWKISPADKWPTMPSHVSSLTNKHSRRGTKSNYTKPKCKRVGHLYRIVYSLKRTPTYNEAICKCARCGKQEILKTKVKR